MDISFPSWWRLLQLVTTPTTRAPRPHASNWREWTRADNRRNVSCRNRALPRQATGAPSSSPRERGDVGHGYLSPSPSPPSATAIAISKGGGGGGRRRRVAASRGGRVGREADAGCSTLDGTDSKGVRGGPADQTRCCRPCVAIKTAAAAEHRADRRKCYVSERPMDRRDGGGGGGAGGARGWQREELEDEK